MSLGAKVVKYRKAKGLSQRDLADSLNVSQGTISGIESDKSIPNSILLKELADELEVDINELLSDTKTNNNVYENNDNGVIGVNNQTFTVYGLPEKLEEQYKKRIEVLEERVAELKELIEYWKNK